MQGFRNAALLSVMLILAGVLPAFGLGGPVLQPVPDGVPLGSGPWKAIPAMDPGLPDVTIYSPPDLAALGKRKMPIVAWAEGGCIDNGTRFRWFLSEIASHGYLVLALGKMGSPEQEVWMAPPPGPPRMPDPTSIPPAETHPAQLEQAMDWAIAENDRPGSRYFGRIDTTKIAVMGMSCGGIQAIKVGADPRVTTTVVWDSGLFPDDQHRNALAGGGPLTKADLNGLHGDVAYISGDSSDIAFGNANDDFQRLKDVLAMRAYRKNTLHEGIYGEENGGDFGRVAVAWLKWRLDGDKGAGRLFRGPNCGLCRDARWVVTWKNQR